MQCVELLSGVEPAQARTYTVTTRTGDVKGAGTTAAVHITLLGAAGRHIGPFALESGRDAFARGGRDEFQVAAPTSRDNLGAIEAVRLEHDNTGEAPDWYLEEVVVTSAALGLETVFPCNAWIAAPDLRRTLQREQTGTPTKRTSYQVVVHTGAPSTLHSPCSR